MAFLGKGILKIYSKFTGEKPCRSAISIILQSNFIEIALRLWCSPVNLLHISRIPFPRNTAGFLASGFLSLITLAFDYNVTLKKPNQLTRFYMIATLPFNELSLQFSAKVKLESTTKSTYY